MDWAQRLNPADQQYLLKSGWMAWIAKASESPYNRMIAGKVQ
jgi:hypothetical protein